MLPGHHVWCEPMRSPGLELLVSISSFAHSSAWSTLLLFFAILPSSLQNASVHTSPGKSFVNIHFPLSNLIIFLLLFFISLFLSFPLSYDISRADTQCCYPRVQHGAHLWIGLKFFFFFFNILYWGILALQFYVIFCCIAKWISHV